MQGNLGSTSLETCEKMKTKKKLSNEILWKIFIRSAYTYLTTDLYDVKTINKKIGKKTPSIKALYLEDQKTDQGKKIFQRNKILVEWRRSMLLYFHIQFFSHWKHNYHYYNVCINLAKLVRKFVFSRLFPCCSFASCQ